MPSLGALEWVIISVCCLGSAGAAVGVVAFLLAKLSNK